MPTEWQVECLRARIGSLKQDITRVADKDHPYSEPNVIYNSLLRVLESRRFMFEQACDLFTGGSQLHHRMLEAEFKETAKQVDLVFDEFRKAARVDSPRIPFEILRCLSWAAKSLLEENCRTVVRLDMVYNYTIASCRRRFEELNWGHYWTEATTEQSDEDAQPFTVLILGFPSPDAGTTLLHSLAAHEFGHEIFQRFAPQIDAIRETALLEAKRRFKDILESYVVDNMRRREGVPQADAYSESSNKLEVDLFKCSYSWLAELWSDLVAARLVGPAFLAAFDRILNNGAACDTHPSGSLRRRLVHQYLEKKLPGVAADPVWASVFPNPKISSAPSYPPQEQRPLEPLYPALESVCSESMEQLADLIDQIYSPLTSGSLDLIVRQIEDRIENLAPPKAPVAVDNFGGSIFWLLMYGVWHFRLNAVRFNKFCNLYGWKGDHAKGEAALSNLLLHALQAAELEFQWNEYETFEKAHDGGGRDGAR